MNNPLSNTAFTELNDRIINLLDSFSALSTLSALDIRNLDAESMLNEALLGLMENMDMERCSIFLLEGDRLVNRVGLDWDDILGQENNKVRVRPAACMNATIGEGIMGLAVKTGTLQHCRDCSSDSRFKTFPGYPIGSLISVPIFQLGGEVLGVLNVSHPQPCFFNEWHERLLLVYCNCLGQLIVNHRLVSHMDSEIEKRTRQLNHSQKMEAIGQLAGGVAHEFNNIMTAIIGYGHLLVMKTEEQGQLRHFASQILTSAERASGLTRSLLTFSRKQITNPHHVNVNETIEKIGKLLSRLIREDIEFRTELSADRLTVLADDGQIEQVLMNLVTNARDAMPGGGVLTISTGMAELGADLVNAFDCGESGKCARISVTDTGIGMDGKTREKIFEPFFTTKEPGKGTGLGMAIVYGIIKQQKGFIKVSSNPGEGTVVNLYLPLILEEGRQRGASSLPELKTGTETLLIAEDDDDVRRLDKELFEECGYTVIEAANGREALDLFLEHREIIDLLMFDVIMPKMNGREVFEEIRKVRPEIKVLFTSGYTGDILNGKGELGREFDFVAKPIPPEELLTKVREVLDRPCP